MSSKSFFNFKYGVSRKPSTPKTPPTKPSKNFTSSATIFQPNADEMKQVFNKLDKNKDGKISKEEYTSAASILINSKSTPKKSSSSSSSSDASKAAFEAMDTDGDGFIDFEEFMGAQKSGGGVTAGDIKGAFKVFDVDGNGKITAEELLQVLRQLGERCSLEACRKMVRGVDADGDGMIDVDEFLGLMTRTIKFA